MQAPTDIQAVNEIALSDVRVIHPWTNAPMNTLLQVLVKGEPAIGQRCSFPVANSASPLNAIVIVAGEKAGRLAVAEHVRGPAFDVSGLVELVVRDPGVFPVAGNLSAGTVVQKGDKYFVWIDVLDGGAGLNGYIQLSDGTYFNGLNPDGLVKIAPRIGVRKKERTPEAGGG